MNLDARHDWLLNAIEDAELLSLRWGDVDGSVGPDEIEAKAREAFGGEAESAVEALIDARLLHALQTTTGERYRSRFAELVRLLVRSRQTFLREAWAGSPPLVADFRVDVRPRRYPRRDVGFEAMLSALPGLDATQRAISRALAPAALAGFQVRATASLLSEADQDRAVIVTAGTGSGKTMAFYMPAFLRIASLVRPNSFWLKAIAIYPRNELLKDQLSEAYRNAGRCRDAMRAGSGRPLLIGTLFGDTPRDPSPASVAAWPSRPKGRRCPFIRCDGCGGDMVWTAEDLSRRRERLTCERCGSTTDEERLLLTRESARRRPPDLLFTTTEMLNRSLSDQRQRALIGVGRPSGERPRFVLLDEAHTYAGTSGAQAGLTLRRWRALGGGPLTWVGLSATLEDASRFFSDLTGVEASRTSEVSPAADEMQEEGREYQVALRSDPASLTPTLSTSIQAAMLIGRTLDPVGGPSQGRYGSRLFAFTDDLDVTHRLFDDLRSAEGYDRFGKPDPATPPLATMRGRVLPGVDEAETDLRRRIAAGQRWELQERIGRPLATRLRIGKTTAGDPGVDGGADAIVATSALEVGFNDPTVGAVLQHKAPRNSASFLQRRGRAGRDRAMRPLTVTVLSDYGRDRALFLAFEHLFDPSLPPLHIPVGNEYLLRMQAAFALLDWIAAQPSSPGTRPGNVWATASGPSDPRFPDEAFRDHVKTIVGRVARCEEEALSDLRRHLGRSLGIGREVVDRLLWEPPRSLLLEVVPTLARRLSRDWRLANQAPPRVHDAFVPLYPLFEFAPRTLFSDLNLPELQIVLPPVLGGPETTVTMPIQQGLMQLAPGRVTRRFGDAYGGLAHWKPLPAGVGRVELAVADFAERLEYLGRLSGSDGETRLERPVFRPWVVRLDKAVASEVKPSSNAFMKWASGFTPQGRAIEVAPPRRTAWQGVVKGAELFLQAHDAGVGVRRFAHGASAEVRRPACDDQLVEVDFVDYEGAAAAVGFEIETDGLKVDAILPTRHAIADRGLDEPVERNVRTGLLRQRVHEDAGLPGDMNAFQRAWLRQIHLLAVAKRALADGSSLEAASGALAREGESAPCEEAMAALLGVQRPDAGLTVDAGDDEGDAGAHVGGGRPAGGRLERLKVNLRARLSNSAVCARLHANLGEALRPGGEARGEFLFRTLESTLAQALLTAVSTLAPRHASADALIVDAERPGGSDEVAYWLTETTVGGAGVLNAVADAIAKEPRALFLAMEAALEPSDLEQASASLVTCYRLAATDGEIAAAVADARTQLGHAARSAARQRLLRALERAGVRTGRAFSVSLNARMLSPGTTPDHDVLVRTLLDHWDATEAKLGLAFDPREIAVLALDDAAVLRAAERCRLFAASAARADQAAALATSLWPRGAGPSGADGAAAYNPFRRWLPPNPAVARALLLQSDAAPADLADANWRDLVTTLLARDGIARAAADPDRPDLIRAATIELAASPIPIGHLRLYPVLERVSREAGRITATFVIKEQM